MARDMPEPCHKVTGAVCADQSLPLSQYSLERASERVRSMSSHELILLLFFLSFFLYILFIAVLSQWDFSHGKFGLPSPGKASCECRATQPRGHAGCFSVSIILRTLTWTTGSLTCAHM